MAIWFSGWTLAGIKGLSKILENRPSRLPLWPIGWAFGEIWAAVTILSLLACREVITITPDFLKRRRQVFGIGWTRQYFLREVLNPRYHYSMGRRPDCLVFDYEGRTSKLISDLTSAEAVELLERIRQKMRECRARETA